MAARFRKSGWDMVARCWVAQLVVIWVRSGGCELQLACRLRQGQGAGTGLGIGRWVRERQDRVEAGAGNPSSSEVSTLHIGRNSTGVMRSPKSGRETLARWGPPEGCFREPTVLEYTQTASNDICGSRVCQTQLRT
ncbi:hypothetical protein C8Q78DRAFT_1049357 [Trametes maxima]|nr:hypothetical protein C8Q78DRAFT_1049357 [Trametes maxima]